ncbi:MAG TPA: aminoglycoside phosphotransferase, partial [Rhizobiales bacterium]|nr:aminoglycoside phosphotransferase [Hyphomicrobiales bacterium]
IWLEADVSRLRDRVRARVGGPSDATTAVLERQIAGDVGAMGWTRVDAGRPLAQVVDEIRGLVGASPPRGD